MKISLNSVGRIVAETTSRYMYEPLTVVTLVSMKSDIEMQLSRKIGLQFEVDIDYNNAEKCFTVRDISIIL